ncbi:hypothetical protein BCU68_08705 [Vibrio sp. 10N.286.49.B3]|uniref:LysR substrate-binding domain-containing protein n=1 Tax=Vibrio sp. 10N.286.49.B3 TaxID=1880855 RepID=UPI000C84C1DB|nr:LysR substrate-binding domain-containing protein [Vibrio sp. 10N.286.49.B3]PMH46142.1 hypothetical protein BCU68_08705 [Vibrio sp. 10N.286.49.B3]
MMPPLKSLVAFEACARNQSILKAANELHVTQAAISQHIKTLEQFLGFALFNREQRRLKLSAKGQKYYPVIHQSLLAIRSQTQTLTHQNEPQQLSIKVNTSFAYYWLVPMLDDFYQQHPYIHVRLHTEDWPQLDGNELPMDIEIVNGKAKVSEHSELICQEYWVAVCSPAFKLKYVQALEKGQYDKLPGIYVTGYAEGWHEWLVKNALPCTAPIKQYEVGSSMMGLELVVQGAGIMLCRSLNATPLLKSGQIVAVSENIMTATESHFLTYNRQKATPKVSLFTQWFKQKLIDKRPDELFFNALKGE